MFEFLYNLIIKPIYILIEFLFNYVYQHSDHLGLTIFLISMFVSIACLPLYLKADELQDEERKIQAKLKDKVDSIKRNYKGDERHFLLQTYYRQNNYHPIMGLRVSLSLLLQIPFFMAAYIFFNKLALPDGTSLGAIIDIMAPDRMISLFNFKINVYPIAMTMVNILASSVGSLTNPQKIYETFKSRGEKELSLATVNAYLSYLEDSFIVQKSLRYDVKGRKYINTPQKYYFSDLGLRNARLNFRQQEETHLMENAIYNELLLRGYNVDVGVVEIREKGMRIQTEVDFVCNAGNNRYYIQSALNLGTHEKTVQESRPLNHIRDNFRKIIIVKDRVKPWYTNDGILVLSIYDFLLENDSIDF